MQYPHFTRKLQYSGNSAHTLRRVVLAPAHYVFRYYRQIKILARIEREKFYPGP